MKQIFLSVFIMALLVSGCNDKESNTPYPLGSLL